jgi:hypothetical protein
VDELGLTSSGEGHTIGIGGKISTRWVEAIIIIPALPLGFVGKHLAAIDMHTATAYKPAELKAPPVIALLGRDLLKVCRLTYDGASGRFSLAVAKGSPPPRKTAPPSL